MARILPIRGLRYNPAVVEDLSRVVTPPYDVIDEESQDRFYGHSPYNIIRLEYSRVHPGDSEADNRYTRAAATFRQWRREGVLVREERPALYLYEQEFNLRGRTLTRRGFFCALYLEPYSTGTVRPHEETLARAKQDRLDLLRASRANFSPIFGLYAEKELTAVQTLLEAAAPEPAVDFRDEQGQTHRLWPVSDPRAINKVLFTLEQHPVFLADGHHRYETALAYRGEINAPGAHNCVLTVLVSLYDPGLVILPAHRLVKSPRGLDAPALLAALETHFEVRPAEAGPVEAAGLQAFMAELEGRPQYTFGLYTGAGRLHFVTLKPGLDPEPLMPADRSPNWRRLEVSVLHHLILERLLGIGGAERAHGDALKYTREEEGALRRVDAGEYDFAFFLNPPGVEELVAVAEDGERMPQKSTYFYPKLSTGLVINAFD